MIEMSSFDTMMLFLLLGFNIGILSGFFGVGGCFILTPILNILGLPMASAVGTGLFFAVIVSTAGGIKHYLAGNTIIKISIMMGLLSFVGIRLSQPLVIYLDQLHLAGFYIRLLYIFLLLLLGFSTLRKNSNSPNLNPKQKWLLLAWIDRIPPWIKIEKNMPKFSIWFIVLLALFVGFLQGFMGVGGGFILVPMLIIFLDMKTHHAVGTSLVTIVISSVFAAFLYFQAGKVIIPASLLLGAGSMFGVNLGVHATQFIREESLKKFYALFLLLASLGIMIKSFDYNMVSLYYMLILSIGVGIIILYRYHWCANRQKRK